MYKTYLGATLMLATTDAASAILRAYQCKATSPASAITIERDGEELTLAEIEELAAALGL